MLPCLHPKWYVCP